MGLSGACCTTVCMQESRVVATKEDTASKWMDLACPVRESRVVNADGQVIAPTRCSKRSPSDTSCCTFVRNGSRTGKKPVYTADGPVFLITRRLLCTTHKGNFEFNKFGLALLESGQFLDPQVIRLGEVSVICFHPTASNVVCWACIHRRLA